jgi:hypothetical protein
MVVRDGRNIVLRIKLTANFCFQQDDEEKLLRDCLHSFCRTDSRPARRIRFAAPARSGGAAGGAGIGRNRDFTCCYALANGR